ncbi:MAG: hypothetical protein CMJ89_14075 [Planctomycetes bacterium]|nr:hypothetical protein [Planctomycetota bacterium]
MIVGQNGDDVFVELSPRMQGVLSSRQFDDPPLPGDVFDFTVLGQEDGLWALARAEEGLLNSWRDMECGSWVNGRVTGRNPGGLELKIGPLHAFMPKSESGLSKEQDPAVLIGTEITCEVIEIDGTRQRVLVSRKRVLKQRKESREQHQVGALKVGQVIHGSVSRIEPYGAFVRFGQGLEGMIHISNLSSERVEHPSEVVKKGQSIEAKILTIRRGGKRVGLGLKQMVESPWSAFARIGYPDQILEGRVTRTEEYGVFVSVTKGVEGLLHNSESGLSRERRLRDVLSTGQPVVVRIVDFDADEERMGLSQLHRDGSPIQPEEAMSPEELAELADEGCDSPASTNLGDLLARALTGDDHPTA